MPHSGGRGRKGKARLHQYCVCVEDPQRVQSVAVGVFLFQLYFVAGRFFTSQRRLELPTSRIRRAARRSGDGVEGEGGSVVTEG